MRNDYLYIYREFTPASSMMIFCSNHQFRFTLWQELNPSRSLIQWKSALMGFEWIVESNITPANRLNRLNRLCIPMWFMMVLFVIYPLIFYYRGPLRKKRRRKSQQCLQCGKSLIGIEEPTCSACGAGDQAPLCIRCGYNLVGNQSGMCPECGKHIDVIRDSEK